MRIIHIADVHWRGLSRHDEYILAFNDFFEKARALNPDVIYVGGDIVHSKTQGISPELIQCLCWWFNKMASICPVHVILGNHDGLILNKDRQDAITPIIKAIDNPNIFLYKDTGVYDTGHPGFKWCVFSCFDEENWGSLTVNAQDVNIALFHGAVRGSLTDIDWQLSGEVNLKFFEKYDFALLGDIHKRQFLNKKKTVAYCGSTIQQNYGETTDKGFLLWDIRSKSDFDVEYVSVKNSHPFITVDWQGDVQSTLAECKYHPRLSRFRVRADNFISQGDAKKLRKMLKKSHNAREVVYKIDSKFDAENNFVDQTSEGSLNLRDTKVQHELLKAYYENQDLSQEEWEILESMTKKYIDAVVRTGDEIRNSRWSINSMRFANTFSYDSDNYINFDNLPGITGIFGRNARGKSSIIGTLVYGLFNSSDRGSIKNLHIINTRYTDCFASIDISVKGIPYRIVRETKKKQTKKNVWAPTTLKFYRLDASGDIVEDLTEEQRRETEKILRKIIGTSEEFLMTSLSSQGEINNFIKEKAAARKNILSNFLDLEIFDKICEMAKKDSGALRGRMIGLSTENWNQKYESCLNKIDEHMLSKISHENKIESLKNNVKELRGTIDGTEELVTQSEVDKKQYRIKKIKKDIQTIESKRENLVDSIASQTTKIKKIENFLINFDLEKIKKKRDSKRKIKQTLIELKGTLKFERKELDNIKKSVNILSQVPCGDAFPTCKFIKNSHKNKAKLEKQEEKVTFLSVKVDDIEDELNNLTEDYEAQIEKFNQVVNRKSKMVDEISEKKIEIERCAQNIKNLNKELKKAMTDYENILAQFSSQDSSANKAVINRINSLEKEVKHHSSQRDSALSHIASWRAKRDLYKKNSEEYNSINEQLKLYDMFIQATSKRGIPVQLLHSLLPKINSEITKILQGVVGFTIELEADLESNSMDIYINYGDSRRIIELASGMEKMMASLAIRVALINVSTLPKTNMLIIDEGFGALDETNLEACSKLLSSFKKWFKNIIIISHIDAIKDIVDNTIDITKKGVDSHVYQP